jgi:hypothetical protein
MRLPRVVIAPVMKARKPPMGWVSRFVEHRTLALIYFQRIGKQSTRIAVNSREIDPSN